MTLQYSDYDNIRDATHGLYAALDSDDKAKINELWRGQLFYQKEVEDVALLAVIPEHNMLRHDQNIQITGAWFICHETGTTAHDTNYAFFRIAWRDAVTTVQTIITNHPTTVANGNIEVWKPYRISLTAPSTNWIVPAGSSVTFQTAKAGAGIIIGKGLVIIEYKLV